MDVIEAIKGRRSVNRLLRDAAPTREQIEALLTAAIEAPNHHDTQPWRFFVLEGQSREAFGSALEAALRRRMAGEDGKLIEAMSNGERRKPLRAPVVIVTAVKKSPENDDLAPYDDLASSAAAVQNMLLAAHAMGLGAIWRTGFGIFDDEVKAHFGLDPEDEILSLLYVGIPDPARPEPPARVREFADKTEWRS